MILSACLLFRSAWANGACKIKKGAESMSCDCKNSFCNALDDNIRCYLCEHSVKISQPARSLDRAAERTDQLEIVESGLLMSGLPSEDGVMQLTCLIYPGCLVGTRYVIDASADLPKMEIKALVQTTKCIIPIKIARELFVSNPQFRELIIKKHIELSETMINYVWLAYKKGPDKVRYVWDLLTQYGVTDFNQITYDDLATISGVSRITVARAMKEILSEQLD